MANRYWVGTAAGTWDASSTTNWSTISGGPGGASAPTSVDAVIFDSLSFYSCTTAAGATCASLSAPSYTFAAILTLGADLTMTGSCSFGQGTLSLATFKLTCSTFSSSVATARTLDFGTGNITVTGTGTVFNISIQTTLTVSGTPVVNVTSTGSTAITVTPGGTAISQQVSFNFTGGTYSLTLPTGRYNNVNFTGYSGNLNSSATPTRSIYGDYTLSPTMTVSASVSATIFAGTSGTQTITTNGVVCNHPFTFNGVGGTFALGSNLATGSTNQTLTHTNGTLNLAGFTANCFRYTTATGTKNLTFNGGKIYCFADSASVFNNAVPAGFTTTAGTGVGIIEMAGPFSKTFAGGGSTFNCTLRHSGGQTQITGANTFTNITSEVNNTSGISFPSATTTTCTNFNVKGSVDFVQTIVGNTAGSQANLVITNKTSGLDYLDIYRINSVNKTPITFWAGANSLNSENNTGIAFDDGTSQQAYLLISGTSFTTPADWNNTSNSIYMFGGGGGGGGSSVGVYGLSGGGGGGGGFRLLSNQTLSGAVSYAIGAGGTAGAAGTGTIVTAGTGGTTTWNTTNTATGGGGGSSRGTIPQSTGGAGGTGTYSGGAGGVGGIATGAFTSGGGGGGGCGWLLGIGGAGGNGGAADVSSFTGGGGGGGNGGGTNGGNAVLGVSSGAGGNNASGVGGAAAVTVSGDGLIGTLGGGGSGAFGAGSGGAGSAGKEILGTFGSGGGSAGASSALKSTVSLGYGGGGGGSGASGLGATAGIAGAQGAIVIVYSIGAIVLSSSNFFRMF